MIVQILRFVIVGGLAALTHFVVVIALVEAMRASSEYEPSDMFKLAANLGGFLMAVSVSYFGHRRWTFESNKAHSSAFPQFFAVALSSFVLNEAMFYALLRLTTLSYQVALAIVLLAVAAFTFVVSKLWVFSAR